MKKIFILLALLLLCSDICFAEETNDTVQAEQYIEMSENKVLINIQKQPLNEHSSQRLILKKNWFVVNVQANGKLKVQPITQTYEME